ncbi:transmembrane protein 59-like isoform X1 [Carcharodon carcharias]|uniref:transmembrane protein 59-like isoform X1 n=1 Tax=Carcharodon carcharias TaxID=13397 RepID=UPI001B7E8B87|nr:transmembrane protein 59-like isoform X1 [Carcharodon carcharias]
MAAVVGICAALLLLLSAAATTTTCSPAGTDPFDSLLGDTARCQSLCRNTFPQAGQPREAPLSACQRGCRLFSICQFVDGISGLNSTRAECEAACLEAYTRMEEQYGCNTGCRDQFLEAEKRQKQLLTTPPEAPSLSIFDYVSTLCSDIVSSAQSFISSTWTFYLQADDGKVVIFQAHPEMEFPPPGLQAMQSNMGEIPREWIPSSHKELVPGTLKPQTDEHQGAEKRMSGRPDPVFKQALAHREGLQSQHDFLGCMSRRSGLPRWILAACLVLSILVMLWLSCASLVTAPEQHVKSQPLSINGDQEGMEKSPSYGLTPLIAVSLREHEEDVGPLPVKVDLSKTLI